MHKIIYIYKNNSDFFDEELGQNNSVSAAWLGCMSVVRGKEISS